MTGFASIGLAVACGLELQALRLPPTSNRGPAHAELRYQSWRRPENLHPKPEGSHRFQNAASALLV